MSNFNDIQKVIDDVVERFEKGLSDVQNKSLADILELIKDMQTRNGRIINSVDNLRKIGVIKNKLRAATVSKEYKTSVKDFVKEFNTIDSMQNNYFKNYVKKFKPPKQVQIIKNYAIDQTIYDLMGQGMVNEVVEPVQNILKDNITTGGSYADFQKQLTDYIVDNDSGDGKLTKYTKQITTDAMHQYSAQYHETIAKDLGFEWGRYVGSDIETTRDFCTLMTDKDYFHVSELPEILSGKIDGKECRLSKSTSLPLGMIPGTNTDNFKVRRGGYNCRHGVYMIPESAVPDHIKNKNKTSDLTLKESQKEPDDNTKKTLGNNKSDATEAKTDLTDIAKKTIDNSKQDIASLRDKGMVIDETIFNKLGAEIRIIDNPKISTSHFNFEKNELHIASSTVRMDSSYYKTHKVFPHEMGHAIHATRNIITNDKVSESYADKYKEFKSIINGKEEEINNVLKNTSDKIKQKVIKRGNVWDSGLKDEVEQLGVIQSTVQALTKEKYGSGHQKGYYNGPNRGEMEVFAHSFSLLSGPNKYADLTPEVKELTEAMIEMSKGY